MTHPWFDLYALVGGMIIGLASALLFVANGRIAGISGIVGKLVGSLVPFPKHLKESLAAGEIAWRAAFLAGLVAGGLVLGATQPNFTSALGTPVPVLLGAGLLVGLGTRIGWGCTSGHGVCGIGRFSLRSVISTMVFMAAGFGTVAIVRLVTSGGV